MTLELEIDVPESRTVTLTLPPDTPVGKATVSVSSVDPLAPLPGTSEKFQRERLAFYRLLPELLKTHLGKVVAIHDGQIIAVGDERIPVIQEATRLAGCVDLFVQQVLEKQPVYRLRGPREIRRGQP